MSDDRPRDDAGQFTDEKDPFAILALLGDQRDWCEPLTATDVADELGWARRTALNKLNALGKLHILTSKKVGGRARVWWLHPQVRVAYTQLLHAESVTQQVLLDAAWEERPETATYETKRAQWQTVLHPSLTAIGAEPTEGNRRWSLTQS